MIIIISVLVVLLLFVIIILKHPKFGAKAKGGRLQRMQLSPNYSDGAFVNRSYTPSLTEGYTMAGVMSDFLFRKNSRTRPKDPIPTVQTDLKNLPKGDWLIWFGHSSYLLQTDGLKILVDPVLSGNASPIPGSTKAFKGTGVYTAEDIPEVDYLLISHDHYDHLDYETVKKLKGKVGKVICGLGVGAHFERWGYDPRNILEMDWDTRIQPQNGIEVYGLTARHFSGRSFKRNSTLWMSYLLQTPTRKIYVGGDSGYDEHFKKSGDLHGPIDLAILENGQYNKAWKAIHFLPGENLQAAVDLKARRVMPVHSSKFDLSMHPWDEPLKEISRRSQEKGISLITPKIGEPVNLYDSSQEFTEWWKDVK